MYAVWRPAGLDPAGFADRLRGEVGQTLVALPNVHGVQVNVLDEDVAAGAAVAPGGLRWIATEPQMEAVVSVWVDSSVGHLRAPVDAALTGVDLAHAGYLVVESEPLGHPEPTAPSGRRTVGWAQLAFLRTPAAMTREAWLERWRDHHTQVAIDTQSTFGYRQNLVVAALHPDAPPFDAIVEELFPTDALTDPRVFFDAVGDPERFDANVRAMVDSTATFIDHGAGLDVLPTSRYVLSVPFA